MEKLQQNYIYLIFMIKIDLTMMTVSLFYCYYNVIRCLVNYGFPSTRINLLPFT